MTDLITVNPKEIYKMSTEQLASLAEEMITYQQGDRRENNLLYYKPASPSAADVHRSIERGAHIIGVGGGNRSSKTETCLVHCTSLATGIFPIGMEDLFMQWFRGPINIRTVLESLTTVLHPIMLPKLQYWTWSGLKPQGGDKGHWGWIPKNCLIDGSWDRSWSEKLRTLTVLCRDPENPSRVLGETKWQFMSFDQDASDFASGTFDIIHTDEPCPYAIWRENQPRVWDVDGMHLVSMTWPDDPSIPVDWIYDEVYEPGLPGPNKDPDIEWHTLSTLENIHLNKDAVLARASKMDEVTKRVRLEGQPVRFSNRVHPLFTDTPATWCFTCGRNCFSAVKDGNTVCGCERESEELAPYVHVEDFEHARFWPYIFVLDPHPRKPHMFCWIGVDPADDLYVVNEGMVEDDAVSVAAVVEEVEQSMEMRVALRLIDPNMGRTPSGTDRNVTWQDEFTNAGLHCELADDSSVGRQRLNNLLKPDGATYRPRLMIHERCRTAVHQMKRYVWDDYKRNLDRDQKQVPKDKDDDFPALLKYCANWEPSYALLHAGAPVLTRPGTRKGAY